MSKDSSPMDKMLGAISQYQEEVSNNQARIVEESEAYRSRVAPFHMAIDSAVSTLEENFTKFFETADIDIFTNWDTAAPLYRAGWNGGRVSRAFMEGFQRLIEKQDTYLTPQLFGWTCHPADEKVRNPLMRMNITFPADTDKDKLRRTAEVVERLFVPMTDIDDLQRLHLSFFWWSSNSSNVYIQKDIYCDSGYSVHSRTPTFADFTGTMSEALEFAADRFASRKQ